MTFVLLVLGLVLLVGGGELLVRGASSLARALGLSPLVIGLTIVSFATSAPELAVTLGATLSGNPGLAVGNVVGSNIANVLLVLGSSAIVLALVVQQQLIKLDIPVMVGLSLLTLMLAWDGDVSRIDGLVLFVLLLLYVIYSVLKSRKDSAAASVLSQGIPEKHSPALLALDALLVAVGVGLLVLGAHWLVGSATTIASAFGVSDLVIGLTVVAVGTSLPELATSIIAVIRGQRDLAIGNVVGSNIFNIGAVLGLAAILSPGGVPVTSGVTSFDLPVMIGVAVLLLAIVLFGGKVRRWQGGVLLGIYAAYIVLVILQSGSGISADLASTSEALPVGANVLSEAHL